VFFINYVFLYNHIYPKHLHYSLSIFLYVESETYEEVIKKILYEVIEDDIEV